MSATTQWISRITVGVTDACNRSIIPLSYLVQQTHQARVGINVRISALSIDRSLRMTDPSNLLRCYEVTSEPRIQPFCSPRNLVTFNAAEPGSKTDRS